MNTVNAKIVSDGTPNGTKVFLESGDTLNVTDIKWEITSGGLAACVLTIVGAKASISGTCEIEWTNGSENESTRPD